MRPVAVSLGLAAYLAAVPARAEIPVLLELDHCDDLDEHEVRRVVAAELGAVPADSGGRDVTRVTVTCSGAKVTLRVEDPLSRKAVQRTFNLGLFDPRARPRLVAIASTELVLASWAELATNPEPHVEPEGPAPSRSAQRAAREIVQDRIGAYEPKERHWYDAETPPDRMSRLLAVGSARSFFGYGGTLWGGGLRYGEERFRVVSWSVDLLFERGPVRDRLQTFDLGTFTTGGWLLAYLRSGAFTGRLGAGLRLGMAVSRSSSLAPWGWPLGVASVSVRFRDVVVELSGEASYVVLPVGGPGDEATLRGTWFSAQLGVGPVVSRGPPARVTEGGAEE